MKVLVTGGAGFIGSHVCEALLRDGEEVVCVDNFNDFYDPKIKERNVKGMLENSNFKLCVNDITDLESMKNIFSVSNFDFVIHLAARAGVRPSIENPLIYNKANVNGTVNLLELSRKFNIKGFIFGSSSSVYGERSRVPFSESDMINRPISNYAASKAACEVYCHSYSHLYSLPVTCLRLFTVYGPRGRPDMAIHKFAKLINQGKEITMFGDGTSKRDYTYVSDIVWGILAALKKNYKFEIINLGDSNPVGLKYLVSLIENSLGKGAKIKHLPIQPGDVSITYADITKAKKLLGYEPKVKIEQGIKKFAEWFKNESFNSSSSL